MNCPKCGNRLQPSEGALCAPCVFEGNELNQQRQLAESRGKEIVRLADMLDVATVQRGLDRQEIVRLGLELDGALSRANSWQGRAVHHEHTAKSIADEHDAVRKGMREEERLKFEALQELDEVRQQLAASEAKCKALHMENEGWALYAREARDIIAMAAATEVDGHYPHMVDSAKAWLSRAPSPTYRVTVAGPTR